MKRSIALALALMVGFTGLVFGQVKAKDGVYFAQESEFAKETGWKDQAIVTVKGGKIVDVKWNGVSNTGVADKLAVVPAGYDMVKYGKAKADWNVQAKAVQDYVLKTQSTKVALKADGTTDAISGASIHVASFLGLIDKALAGAPVAKGIYSKDGWYFAQQAAFDKETGWKDSVLITVVNGSVVDVIWNGTYKDNTKKSKLVEDLAGKYGMEKAAKKGAWNVQAKAVQDAIIKTQDPAKIALKPDTTTDAISGASIHATAVVLAVEALKAAR
jgi:Major membrane immunogen, membrane-anchored lipoprotein